MNARTPVRHALAFGLLLAVSAAAQLPLHRIYSRSVREWKNVPTKIDTVLVDTRVKTGIATTTLTMVLEPGAYRAATWVKTDSVVCRIDTIYHSSDRESEDKEIREHCYTVSRKVWQEPEKIDSVEISSHFQLPADFVATDMYLWVEGEPVRAEIQDRSLARGQYEEIVNRRKDPALLEFYGNGSYSLRIFPAASFEARKIAITFRHTFDDDSSGLITARIPVTFDSAYGYYSTTPEDHSPIGYFKATLGAADGKTYRFDMEGLGGGWLSSSPLVLEKKGVDTLAAGVISMADPSRNDEFFWSGRDTHNGMTLGFATMLAESTVQLEPEPETRIIVLDIRNALWNRDEYHLMQKYYYDGKEVGRIPDMTQESQNTVNLFERARTYAAMCLTNYVNSDQKFNLIIAGQARSALFEKPVAGTPANLKKAFAFLRNAEANKDALTRPALEEALRHAGEDIVILISDLYRPYNYQTRSAGITTTGTRYNATLDSLDSLVQRHDAMVYTIDDEWRLSGLARRTGGFRLASLRGTYYYYYEPYAVDGVTKQRPSLPDLFGGSYYNRGVTDVTVTASGADSIVYTLDGYPRYYGWGFGGPEMVMMDGMPAMRKPGRIAPWYPLGGTRMIRVAAIRSPIRSDPAVSFTIRGTMNGLRFTKTVEGEFAVNNTESNLVQWAFRNSEYLAEGNWTENAPLVKAIGKEYHIVTRQTSLLALEPGMEMWEDTLDPNSSGTEAAAVSRDGIAPTSEQKYANTGGGERYAIDELSFEDIASGAVPALDRSAVLPEGATAFSALMMRGGLRLTMPATFLNKNVTVTLYDLQGRAVATRRIASLASRQVNWQLEQGIRVRASRFYLVRVEAAGEARMLKVPVVK